MSAKAELKAKGIDEVIFYCVNDGAVMAAWRDSFGIKDGDDFVTFLGDPSGAFTKALDLEMTHEGPVSVLGNVRSKRFAITFDNGKATNVFVAEGPGDPAGDNDPTVSFAAHVLKHC